MARRDMGRGVEKPTGTNDYYPTIRRGVVVDVDDPQRRMRLRVRVSGIHPQEVPNDHLPWAEVMYPFAAKLAGDFHHFEVGDTVWVAFEGGDRRLPIVTGAWVSRSAQLNDVPNELTSDYLNTRRRWVRLDRVGNKIELSEVPNEQWARMVSGAAEVVCDQKDGSVTLRTQSGAVAIDSKTMEMQTKFFALSGGQVIIQADAVSDLGGATGVLQMVATLEANLHGGTEVTIGDAWHELQADAEGVDATAHASAWNRRGRDHRLRTDPGN